MALVFGLKYKHPERVLAVLDEETPVIIEQNDERKKDSLSSKIEVKKNENR